MALFQRRPQVSDSIQLYTLGQNKTVLLVGLGNIGKQYDGTRHNIGFFCIDHFVAAQEEMDDWIEKKDLKCYFSRSRIGDTSVIAIKPTTFMNLSGQAVQAVASFYKIATSSIVVIHDELDIDFGQIRLRVGGASAGHNGVKSITQVMGEDYGRVRIGVGPKTGSPRREDSSWGEKTPEQIDSADFVLRKFSATEQKQLPNLAKETTSILTEYIYSGQLPHDTRSFLV